MTTPHTTPEPDNVAILHPNGYTVRVIQFARSASAAPLSSDEEIMLAQYREIERLKSGQAVTAAPQEGVSDLAFQIQRLAASPGQNMLKHASDIELRAYRQGHKDCQAAVAKVLEGFAPEAPQPLAPPTHEKPHYLSIERAQGLPDFTAGPVPVLYSDGINGCMVRRDDVWLATTAQLAAAPPTVVNVEATGDAETYLRGRYGAYRGHFAWRELEEAFNAGMALPPGRGMVPMTEDELQDLWLNSSTGNHDTHPVAFARAIEAEHGIKEGS